MLVTSLGDGPLAPFFHDTDQCSYGSLENAFSDVMAKYLIVSYNSDWLFTTAQSREIVQALLHNEKDVSFVEIDSPYGHDAFLVEDKQLKRIIVPFLDNL